MQLTQHFHSLSFLHRLSLRVELYALSREMIHVLLDQSDVPPQLESYKTHSFATKFPNAQSDFNEVLCHHCAFKKCKKTHSLVKALAI